MALSVRPGLTLYFCRHGETVANVEKRFQGRTRDTALTPKGIEQARDIGRIVKHDVPGFDRLAFVSSPLPRARHTMELIRSALSLNPDGFTMDDRLMEIDLGKWDGLTDAEAAAQYPQEFVERGNDKWNVRVPGGENYADVAARAESWVSSLAVDTFAVSHGAFTRILRGLFAGYSWAQMSNLDETQGVAYRVRGSEVERLDPP